MATHMIDAPALETLLIQALSTSDHLEYEQVGVHLATALDALRRETARPHRRAAGGMIPRLSS